MGLFKRLMTYSPRPGRIPREDFTTELFCGVLNLNEELRLKFMEYLLSIGDNPDISNLDIASWDITTQHVLDNRKRPDVAIATRPNTTPSIFIEHKIDSIPCFKQLEEYANHLGKTDKLFLLTKYYDIDENQKLLLKSQCDFEVIWWHVLAPLLTTWITEMQSTVGASNDYLMKEFVTFLKEERMFVENRFDRDKIVALKYVQEAMKIIDVLLGNQRVRTKFTSLTSKKAYMSYSSRSTQVQNFGRYIVFDQVAGIAEATEYAYILLGVQFSDPTASEPPLFAENELPCAIVGIETKPEVEASDYIRQRLEHLERRYAWTPVKSEETWTKVQATKPFNTLDSEHHVDELSKWFISRLDELSESGF